jgi:3-mercaptopyruvate sulfurtransferase SseA
MELLVSTEWLADQFSDPGLKIIETSWKPEGYRRAHIDGALQLPWHSYLKGIDENGE